MLLSAFSDKVIADLNSIKYAHIAAKDQPNKEWTALLPLRMSTTTILCAKRSNERD
jgi:hypothetical protein